MPYQQDTEQCVCFYEQEFGVLSNFAAFRLHFDGYDFQTSEHAYQWSKFDYKGAGLLRIREAIRCARSAHAACQLAEEHRHLVDPRWPTRKVVVMREILRAKAQEHAYVRRKLLETGTHPLIGDGWCDTGEMVGRLWMEIRAELQAGADAAVRSNDLMQKGLKR